MSDLVNMRSGTLMKLKGDHGAVIVEAALVLPFLSLVMLGVLEFGTAFRDKTTMASGVRAAARQLTNLRNNPQADLLALQSLQSVLASSPRLTVSKVVVFRAAANGSPTSADCLTKPPTVAGNGTNGACNIYGPTQMAGLTAANFGATYGGSFPCSPGTKYDRFWCAPGRNGNQATLDSVGIRAEYTRASYTKLLPGTTTMTDSAVYRLEPA